MIAAIVEWVWTATSTVGSLFLFYLAREAFRERANARREGERRLILVAVIAFRNKVAWLTALLLFAAAGISSLFRPNDPTSDLLLNVTRISLLVAVVVVMFAMARSWRDTQELQELIRGDIVRRLRRGDGLDSTGG